MLCKLCNDMLYANQGRKYNKSNLQLEFWHQESRESLHDTAKSGCYICRVLNAKVQNIAPKEQLDEERQTSDKKTLLSASLSAVPLRHGLYRLDFQIAGRADNFASFALEENDGNHPERSASLPVSTDTKDSKVFEIARKWIKECEDNHSKCKVASSSQERYPTRLLHIETMDTDYKIKLVSQKDGERRHGQPTIVGYYATLSHCWGKNISQCLVHGLYAIVFAAKLGIKWIWIDALCILQGKDEASQQDWLSEAVRMQDVYKNAYFNISATASRDSFEGLYRKRDDRLLWVDKVTLNTKELCGGVSDRRYSEQLGTQQQLSRCTILDMSFWDTYIDTAPVNRRSWVLQERILARRVIHFCQDQIAFECRDSDRAECRPDGLPHYQTQRGELVDGTRLKSFDTETGRQLRVARLGSRSSSKRALAEMVEPNDPSARQMYFYELWKRIVDAYTKMEITDEKDRLIALSGIAREMASEMKSYGLEDKYIAGMWQQAIAQQLLWYVNDDVGPQRQSHRDSRPKDPDGRPIYRAPSFSWGSVESTQGVSFLEPTDARSLVQVHMVRLIYPRGEDMYGLLTDGYIILKGVLRRTELTDKKATSRNFTMTRTLRVRSLDTEPSQSSHQQTTYFISLGIHARLTSRTAAGIAMWILAVCFLIMNRVSPLPNNFFTATIIMNLATALEFSPLLLLLFNRNNSIDNNNSSPNNADHTTNRYSWRLVKLGSPTGPAYETIYLDSAATQPSIFGPEAKIYCVPALEDDVYLTCIIVQATEESDYGLRYRRVGLAKMSKLYGDARKILDVKTAPGHNEIKDGQYYWILRRNGGVGRGEVEEKDGESTICII